MTGCFCPLCPDSAPASVSWPTPGLDAFLVNARAQGRQGAEKSGDLLSFAPWRPCALALRENAPSPGELFFWEMELVVIEAECKAALGQRLKESGVFWAEISAVPGGMKAVRLARSTPHFGLPGTL